MGWSRRRWMSHSRATLSRPSAERPTRRFLMHLIAKAPEAEADAKGDRAVALARRTDAKEPSPMMGPSSKSSVMARRCVTQGWEVVEEADEEAEADKEKEEGAGVNDGKADATSVPLSPSLGLGEASAAPPPPSARLKEKLLLLRTALLVLNDEMLTGSGRSMTVRGSSARAPSLPKIAACEGDDFEGEGDGADDDVAPEKERRCCGGARVEDARRLGLPAATPPPPPTPDPIPETIDDERDMCGDE